MSENDRAARLNLGEIIPRCTTAKSTARSLAWFFDREWEVRLGDPLSLYDAVEVVASIEEAAEWLRANAVRLYPDSTFAKFYRGFGPG